MDRSKVPIVDAHHHFWDPLRNYHPWLTDLPMIPFRYGDYSSIRKPFLPADYRKITRNFNIIKSITVEGEWDPRDPIGETRWIHEIAADHAAPDAHVAQIWLDHDNVEETLSQLAEFPLVRSVRHKPYAAPSPDRIEPGARGGLGHPKYRRGFRLLGSRGFRFDLQVPWWHLFEALDLAESAPETTVILNHTGLPSDRSDSGLNGWRSAMKAFASFPNAAVKISGLGLPGTPWRTEDNRSIVLDTIEMFGVDRCMFAGNFPVDSLVASFDTIFNGYFDIVAGFEAEIIAKLFCENACTIYAVDRG